MVPLLSVMVQPIVELTVYFLLICVGIVFITGLYFAVTLLQLQAVFVLSAMSHARHKTNRRSGGTTAAVSEMVLPVIF